MPQFYAEYGVPDSLDGRFEMLVLHTFLLIRRLKREEEAGRHLIQSILDLMFADMDGSLREMGVGDLGVEKRVKAMARAFFGHAAAYDEALASTDEATLVNALERNLYGTVSVAADVIAIMADYVRLQEKTLDANPGAELLAGKVRFAPPSSTM